VTGLLFLHVDHRSHESQANGKVPEFTIILNTSGELKKAEPPSTQSQMMIGEASRASLLNVQTWPGFRSRFRACS